MRKKIEDFLSFHSIDVVILAEGYDESLVGFVTEGEHTRAIYDKEKMIAQTVACGMGYIEAIEYLEFNTFDAYVGEGTPIYMDAFS
jgi:hypothetical protein